MLEVDLGLILAITLAIWCARSARPNGGSPWRWALAVFVAVAVTERLWKDAFAWGVALYSKNASISERDVSFFFVVLGGGQLVLGILAAIGMRFSLVRIPTGKLTSHDESKENLDFCYYCGADIAPD